MKRSLLVLLAVVALMGAACGGGDNPGVAEPTDTQTTTPAESPTTPPTETPSAECEDLSGTDPFKLELYDNFFEPTCLIVNASQPASVENTGSVTHTWTIDGTQVDLTFQPGEEKNLEGGGVAPGTYTFYCKFHGSPDGTGMAGTLTAL